MTTEIIILIASIVGGIILITVILFAMIKTAKGNEALVVSGVGATDKYGNPKIKRAGGRVVIPFIQKAKYFDLCVRTAKVEGDVTKTQTGVPIQIDWAVAYNPDVSSNESLQRAVCNFLDKNDKELERVILDVVSGGVRAVIAKMTPEEVMNGKDKLDDQVKESISAQMKDLGFNTILSIHEVEDAAGSTYYKDLAARDRETRRRDAANISAEAEQSMREKRAETDRIAQEKELDAQVAVAERQRDTDVKRAQFMAETAREQVKSQMAADLEQEAINQQLAEKQGTVLVTKAEQANRAALKQQEVEITRAETQKKTTVINAQAEAERKKAEAAGEAEAKKVSAAGNAEAQKLYASNKNNHADRRRPAGNRIAPHQTAYYNNNQHDKTENRHQNAAPGSQFQRRLGEIHDAVHRVADKVPETPFRRPGRTFDILIRKPVSPKTYPAENSLGKTVIFAHRQHRLDHLARHQAKIACTVHNIGIGNSVGQLVKFPCTPAAKTSLAVAVLPPRRHAVILAGLQYLDHLRQQRRRILHVRVHDGRIISVRIAEPRVHGRFLAEIPGEGQISHVRILRGERLHDIQRAILRAVVNQQKLIIIRKRRQNLRRCLIKKRQ